MDKKTKNLVRSAIIAALYATLTHLQNLIAPGSASWAIQLRMSEALCVLAFFTPAAIPGLSLGCLLFNITSGAGLPLDFLVGTLATLFASSAMWHSRRLLIWGIPVAGLAMPALFNAVLVGWELTVYIGGGFWVNALYVALGELIVLYIPGAILYHVIRRRNLDTRFFA